MNDMDEIVHDFLIESQENLDRLDRDFVDLEATPGDREILSAIFRTIHTIKGTCGFLGFDHLGELTHLGETLLSRLRDGELELTTERTTVLLSMADAVREMLRNVETSGTDEGVETTALRAQLERLGSDEAPEPARQPDAHQPDARQADVQQADVQQPAEAQRQVPTSSPIDASVRVDVRLLDRLMNLVGELVLARNQLMQSTATTADQMLLNTSQRLSLITTDLQEGVMRTRMQPIASLFAKVPRVVRDLAVTCERSVRVELDGEDTELDRTVLEAIRDPLTHLLRNAVDHGIEPPAVRVASGKPAEGRLGLRSYHESGQVVIELSDDGRGIDPSLIAAVAIERDVISATEAAELDERALTALIFRPGFSTASNVTNVSGRGVGMDVVKTDIERIGGTIDVHSMLGAGTTFTIKIPLTLAIIPALVVVSDGVRYAIAQVALVELLLLDHDRDRVETIAGQRVFRLRGELLPIVDLHEVLTGDPSTDRGEQHVVVLSADGRQFGLVVDFVCDTEEIVVKPLSSHFGGLGVYMGATLMGDGAVSMILDAGGIASAAGLDVESNAMKRSTLDDNAGGTSSQLRVVVCEVAGERVALPLERVERLEELHISAIERGGGRDVVQYRDTIMGLVHLGELLGRGPTPSTGSTMSVLVHRDETHHVGLVVDSIVDVVDIEFDRSEAVRIFERSPGEHRASTVVLGRVTDLIDVDAALASSAGWPCRH